MERVDVWQSRVLISLSKDSQPYIKVIYTYLSERAYVRKVHKREISRFPVGEELARYCHALLCFFNSEVEGLTTLSTR